MKEGSSPIISVLIPVYNVEPYLRECLDSVVNQSLRDIEIICVNDCSTDGSLSILLEYASKDGRMVVVDKKVNEGLSAARNTGMAHASGRYMIFVDSDDSVDTDLCRKALRCAEENKAQVVIYDFAAYRNSQELAANRKTISALRGIYSSDRGSLLKTQAFAWTKLIQSEFARSLDIKFPKVELTYEDMPVHWQLIALTPRIGILPERLCFYRQRNSSMSYRRDWTLADRVVIYDSVRDFLVSHDLYEKYRDVFLESQLDLFCWLFENVEGPNKDRMMTLIQNRISEEHWEYLDSRKPISWKTRDFYRAIRGSYLAKARRALWFIARDCYRSTIRPDCLP